MTSATEVDASTEVISFAPWRHRPVYMYLARHDNPAINAEDIAGPRFSSEESGPRFLEARDASHQRPSKPPGVRGKMVPDPYSNSRSQFPSDASKAASTIPSLKARSIALQATSNLDPRRRLNTFQFQSAS
jgi:hypothetical protein